jgi:hypothetical protein
MAYDPQWQTAFVPFVAGLETKAAAAVIPVERLAVLENGVFTKTGSVKKRAGYAAVRGDVDRARHLARAVQPL